MNFLDFFFIKNRWKSFFYNKRYKNLNIKIHNVNYRQRKIRYILYYFMEVKKNAKIL